jgi:hypothetical protein
MIEVLSIEYLVGVQEWPDCRRTVKQGDLSVELQSCNTSRRCGVDHVIEVLSSEYLVVVR